MPENNGIDSKQISSIVAATMTAIKEQSASSETSAAIKINEKVQQRAVLQQNYASKIKQEMAENKNCTIITIDRIYHKYQPTFVASVNGCTISIPANGKPYKVHNDFAIILKRRMRSLSNKIDRMNNSENNIYEIPNGL